MGEPVITFDGRDKRYLKLVAPYSVLKRVAANVSGVNLSRDKRYLRCARDEMSCYYIMKFSGYQPDQEVLSWLYELKHQRERLSFVTSNVHEGFKLSTGYEAWLYKFQTCDVTFMVEAKRCINANDVGVGKTIEAIAAADEVYKPGQRILVIAPKSLMYMWRDEFMEHSFGNVVVCEEKSSYKRREKLLAKIETESRVKVISYSLLDHEKWPQLFDKPWDVIICDEAHKLKNPETKQTKNFMKLKSEYLWLLTATPDPNGNLEELFGMLSCIDPQRFTSKWAFVERYGDIVEEDIWTRQGIKTVQRVQGIREDAKPVLHRLLVPYMFKRKIGDEGVHNNLPKAIDQAIKVELSAYERKIYDDLMKEMLAKLAEDNWLVAKNTLDRDIRLRMLLLNPALVGGKEDESAKTSALLDLIDSIPGQVVVFTNFKQYTRYLEELFRRLGISALRIDGDIDAEEIRRREKAFQQGEVKVIHGTIAKMGEGFNFQNAQAMIMMDKSYVPKDNHQARGRILRPGQKNVPVIYSVVARNTIDELIENALARKQENINAIEAFQYIVDELKAVYVK